ncbi:hypothetical protein SCA6_009666, partial [Theobroma cacao]
EFPLIRYRAAKSIDATTPTTFCDLIPTKLAAGVWNHLMKYKQIMPNFPQAETCDLLILDRSVDQIAPVIHEWFYDAMCHDLLDIEGNKYVRENTTHEDKLRLLMILAAIYPEELEGEKGLNWMKLAKLPAEDMSAVNNMKLLGGSPDAKKSFTGIFSLKFDFHKRRHVARKERIDVEETWQLSRFYPMIEELIENLSNGELSEKEYPCLNGPSATSYGSSPTSHVHQGLAHSTRSRRTPTWAKRQNVDDKYSSDSVLKHASSDLKRMGRRIFVFIAGGATRSELRVCHKLTNKLKREIVLGSSSLDDPSQFVSKLKQLAAHELSLDVRKI